MKSKKTTPEKSANRAAAKKAVAKKFAPFTLRVKSRFNVANATPLAGHMTKFMAVCTFEHKNLTAWTDEATADKAASDHSIAFSHPVTVLESH